MHSIAYVGEDTGGHLTGSWFTDGFRGEGTTDEGVSGYLDLKTKAILPDMLYTGFKIKFNVDGSKGGASKGQEGG